MKTGQIRMAGSVLGAGLLLAACTPQVTTNVPDVITVQIAESTGAAEGQNVTGGATEKEQTVTAGAEEEERTVTVSAAETVKVTPDMAQITYEIITEDADAEACQQKNSETLDAVIAYLKEQSVAEASIKTSDFSLNPQYDWSGDRQRLIGYEMDTQLTVSDVPMGQVGELLSGAVSSGANRIGSVSYYASGYDEAYEQALALAMEMAKEKAEAIAHAGGCQVTDVLSVTESSDRQSGRYVESGIQKEAAFAADASNAAMSVMAGEMEVEAEITVVYRLLPQ